MTKEKRFEPQSVSDEALDNVNGGIALLLPAVQKVREAASRAGDGSVKTVSTQTSGNGI
jgi:hypothetical protein